MIRTKGSDYIDEHREEIEDGFEIYYTEQKRIKSIKEKILAPLKSLLPAEPYKIVERIVRDLDMPSGELEKLILDHSSINIK
ncbi:hypothetical protein J4438_02800 [Candidatus Woesearchaeota archaeon]|nr:hypothetical protein [Candidatus Woesearchaeota archaeon]